MNSKRDDEIDQLLLNAQLRDEIEPYIDESLQVVNTQLMPTHAENEYLRSMLEWERAPVLPISRWFRPALKLPTPESLGDAEVHEMLWTTIHKLFQKRIVLDFTEHLSDRELYCLIYRDILPSLEKNISRRNTYIHWQCIDSKADPDIWLRYYATDEERHGWSDATGNELPPSQIPPFPREMPRRSP